MLVRNDVVGRKGEGREGREIGEEEEQSVQYAIMELLVCTLTALVSDHKERSAVRAHGSITVDC